MEEVILTKSAEDTQNIAKSFATKIKNGGIVLLYGNLGAGKTTFVQGLAEGLEIKNRIISPTFIIMRTYSLPQSVIASEAKQSSFKEIATSQSPRDDEVNFYHIDLYRLEKENDIEGIGLIELMKDPKNIIVIEWPEKLGNLTPQNAWKISFETMGENERKITINS